MSAVLESLAIIAGREIRLLDNAVLLRLIRKPRKSEGGLHVPDNADLLPHELYEAEVIATGPGQFRKIDGKRNPMEVRKGDRVMVYWTSIKLDVTEIYEDGKSYRIVSEDGIQMVLDSPDEAA